MTSRAARMGQAYRLGIWLGGLCLLGLGACTDPEPRLEEAAPAQAGSQSPVADRAGMVVVNTIAPGSPLLTAGVEPGDRLLAWRRGDRVGEIDHFDDAWEVEVEEALRGPVSLVVDRGGRTIETLVPPGRWRLEARPELSPDWEPVVTSGLADLAAGRIEAGREALESVRREVTDPNQRAWLAWRQSGEAGAEGLWAAALDEARAATDPGLEAWLSRRRCLDRELAGELEAAVADCGRCAELRRLEGQELLAAECLYRRSRVVGRLGDPGAEEEGFREVLARLETLGPDNLLTVRTLHGVAKARATQDDLEGALALGHRALELAEDLAPGGLDHQASEMVLGIFHWFSSDWALAEMRIGRSLEILQGLDPGNVDVANALNNLGLVAGSRRDLGAAEDYYRRSLEARERAGPDPLQASRTLNNLATLSLARGDLGASIAYDRRVLELRRELAPDSLDLATPLLNLGANLVRVGELDEAEVRLTEALGLQRRYIPGTRDVCRTLNALGRLQEARGDLEIAARWLTEAAELCAAQASHSVLEAEVQVDLARVQLARGRLEEAEALAREAVETVATLVPGTLDQARALHSLGLVLRRQGRLEEALTALRAATEALDAQLGTLGGGEEAEARFRASWRHIDRDLMDLWLELGRPEAAFEVLEKSRSRSFLSMVRGRELGMTAGADADLAAAWETVQSEYDEVQERLVVAVREERTRALPGLLEERRELQHRRDRLGAEIRRELPRLGEVEVAFDATRAREALGPSVGVISFSVDHTGTRVWALGPGGLRVVEIDVDAAGLRDRVDRFRLLVGDAASVPAGRFEPMARRLYELLFAPVEAELAAAERLVIVPDGPLHHLPFAALRRGEGSAGRYLVEWKPLLVSPSVTAWALLDQRPAEEGPWLAAFADPPLPETPAGSGGSLLRAEDLRPLPGARREVEALHQLYAERLQARLGTRATEAAAKELGRETRVLHFATHAWVDPRSPLDSALVLHPSEDPGSGRHNGLLQAWEIVQELHLEAALVTLSACETGSGPVLGDEGILGLTRAFQFAGARGVVASLWRVSDRATGDLMDRFYRHLAAGAPVDEALRAAQLAALDTPPREPRGSIWSRLSAIWSHARPDPEPAHPYFWSGFQLFGAAGRVGG